VLQCLGNEGRKQRYQKYQRYQRYQRYQKYQRYQRVIGIFGCGGANTGPVNYLKESEILDLLGQGFEKIKSLNKKIMVTHAHPSDSITEKFSNFIPGSKAVRAAIDKFQPDLLLCGHVHEAAGLEEKIGKTRVINVGRQGTWIDI